MIKQPVYGVAAGAAIIVLPAIGSFDFDVSIFTNQGPSLLDGDYASPS